jgi:outer membrane protein assembly factor BamB
VLVADRDPLDTQDIFRCLRADTGEEVWTLRDPARGRLDYGNSPRATPLIAGELAWLYNAFGRLHCVRLSSGEVVWKKDLAREFPAEDRHNAWGMSSSPLIVDDKLIINPGADEASVVALNPRTGDVIWKTAGGRAAFSSFIVAELGGRRQLVGYDRDSLNGFEVATGRRLWRLVPPRPDDFNVPTPIAVNGKLLVATENNGLRLFRFDEQGVIVPEPIAVNEDLAPDTHTPVVLGNRVLGVWAGLHCLDVSDLKTVWRGDDPAFLDYAIIIGSGSRALVVSQHAELLLLDVRADKYQPLGRLQVLENDPGVMAHAALVGQRLFLRGSEEIVCLKLPAAGQ